jgi:hypothetical protein
MLEIVIGVLISMFLLCSILVGSVGYRYRLCFDDTLFVSLVPHHLPWTSTSIVDPGRRHDPHPCITYNMTTLSHSQLVLPTPHCTDHPEMIQLQSQEQESHVQSLGDELEHLTQQLEETSRQLEDVRWERDEARREKEEVRRRMGEEVRGLNEGIVGMQVGPLSCDVFKLKRWSSLVS